MSGNIEKTTETSMRVNLKEAREFVKELQKQTSEIGYVLREISTGNRVYIIN